MRLDTLVRVETPEGIALALRTAGLVARSHAFLIDLAIRAALLLLFGMLLGQFAGLGIGLLLVLAFGVEWFYPVVFELSGWAATPGKRALGLRVVMDDGMPVTLSASMLRNLLRVVDFLPMIYATGVLFMLWRADFRRVGDIVAGTLVIHDQLPVLHGKPRPAPPLAPAVKLSPAQQTAIVDWALRTPRLTVARAEELALLAAPALASCPGSPGSPGERLLRLAHWALGHR